MKLEMTELGPVKRALKIEVPEEAVKSEFQKVYAELKRQVRIPGFRPGKGPVDQGCPVQNRGRPLPVNMELPSYHNGRVVPVPDLHRSYPDIYRP